MPELDGKSCTVAVRADFTQYAGWAWFEYLTIIVFSFGVHTFRIITLKWTTCWAVECVPLAVDLNEPQDLVILHR